MSSVEQNINSNKDLQRYLKYNTALEFITRAQLNILGNDINNYLLNNNLIDPSLLLHIVSSVKNHQNRLMIRDGQNPPLEPLLNHFQITKGQLEI
jgi:hypothetical protein